MQRWEADHEAMLNAGLAGLKAGLNLTADQEKLWPPFEATVRDAARSRMEEKTARLQDMTEMMRQKQDQKEMSGMAMNPAASPGDWLDALGRRLSERGAALEKVADAVKPLYASLDESQKRLFALLSGELLMPGHGHGGMGMMGGMGGGAEKMGGDRMGGMGVMCNMMGKGMMGQQGMMGMPSEDAEDNSDE